MAIPLEPVQVQRLQQILGQEERNGYADRAVIGGLDRFLQQFTGDGDFPAPAPSYGALSPSQRLLWAQHLRQWLDGGSSRPPNSTAHPVSEGRPGDSPSESDSPGREPVEGRAGLVAPFDKLRINLAHHERAGSGPRAASIPSATTSTPAAPARRKRLAKAAAEAPVAKVASSRRERSQSLTLTSPLSNVPGFRRDVVARLGVLGVETIRDALYFFPRRHLDFSQIKPISELSPGPEETAAGFVWQVREVTHGPRRRGTELVLGDETGNIRAVWFNQPYLVRVFQRAPRVILSGRVAIFRGQKVFESPEYEVLDTEDGDLTHTGRLVPVYPLTIGLSGRTVRRLIKGVVDVWAAQAPDPLPDKIRNEYRFLPLPQALQSAHYPASREAQDEARRRIAFDELFAIQLGVLSKQREWQSASGYPIPTDQEVLGGFKASLPFRLTAAQERVLENITQDLAQPKPMSRLLQGDVGSGKTVVAAAALVLAAAAGYQGALMAPTEILAEQHYRTLSRLFGHPEFQALEVLPLPYLQKLGRPLRLGLLTGSLRTSEKQRLQQEVASGQVDILVGTHALIQEGVSFDRLGLAITDEQHRFGVAQRARLRRAGGGNPHVLVMTATPIPRTLALTLYGDLESSVLDEMPPGRQPIETHLMEPRRRPDAYRFLREQVAAARQAFIICPLIEESAVVEARAATAEHQRLSQEVYPDLRLGLLHGRMAPAEKDAVMEQFRLGELDILVSTSVIEVGIDVPNATVMLIEGADRFGLSQLHQLRGRVGRGQHQSYCLLLTESPSAEAQERLTILAQTTDGFKLAEEDLRLRGPGEFFGTRQTGLPELQMARLDDWALLDAARNEARALLAQDPELALPEHQGLKDALARLRPLGQTDLS